MQDKEAVLEKIISSAFEGTSLSVILRGQSLTSVAIGEMETEIGTELTVRHGTHLGCSIVRTPAASGHAWRACALWPASNRWLTHRSAKPRNLSKRFWFSVRDQQQAPR